MNKDELEIKLASALEKGFVPAGIPKPSHAGPIRVVDKEGEDERITIEYRTMEEGGQMHRHQHIYSLDEVVELLKEFKA